MLPALMLALAALGIALLRLWAYRAQLLEMARALEETPTESNLRLTVRMSGTAPRRLCQAVNARLDEGRRLRLETQRRERELKYTMACISHDIRTPLAGAMGYLALLEGEPERQAEYRSIIDKRLRELDELLDELFLYTRLQSGSLPLECRELAALPPLWDALAEFYPQLEAAGVEPELRFDREDMTLWASPEALGRVYHRQNAANAASRERAQPMAIRRFFRCLSRRAWNRAQSSPSSSGGRETGVRIRRSSSRQAGQSFRCSRTSSWLSVLTAPSS